MIKKLLRRLDRVLMNFELYRLFKDKIGKRYVLELFLSAKNQRVRLEDCVFDVSSPLISPKIKSALLTGNYESEERDFFRKYVPYEDPLVELGGSIGVLSCITNKCLEPPNDHLVVEADPELAELLEQNRELNDCNFGIVSSAIGYDSETVSLHRKGEVILGSTTNKTGVTETISVPAVTLEGAIREKFDGPFNLICDIEGTEHDLVREETDLLQRRVKYLLIELHDSPEANSPKHTIDRLLDADFELLEKTGAVYCLRNRKLSPE